MIRQVWPDVGIETEFGTMSDKEIIAQVQAYLNHGFELMNEATAQFQHAAAVWAGMGGNVMPQVTTFSQRDPAWAGIHLGTSSSTIGGYGCLITAVASMLSDAGKPYNPQTMNAWLILNGGYSNGNLFAFASVDKLGVVKYDYNIECATKPAPMTVIEAELKAGKFVIVKVDFNPATVATEEHWVRYLGDGQMFDPWAGDIAPIVPRYRGADAAQAILRCLVYKRSV
jgi:hypothetical protein